MKPLGRYPKRHNFRDHHVRVDGKPAKNWWEDELGRTQQGEG